jgi:hypothetical protein
MAVIDLDRKLAEREGIEVPKASAEVLKRIGVSRQRWNRMTIAQQIEALLQRVERDENKTEALKGMPVEPISSPDQDAQVVWFVKNWGGEERYEYVAISTPKGWIISGQNKTSPKSWTEVLMFSLLREQDDFNPEFHVATGWTYMERA